MVDVFLTECTILLDFNLRPILKSFVIKVYDLIKDPRMLVAIRNRYELT